MKSLINKPKCVTLETLHRASVITWDFFSLSVFGDVRFLAERNDKLGRKKQQTQRRILQPVLMRCYYQVYTQGINQSNKMGDLYTSQCRDGIHCLRDLN